jgi:hypothetical protein
VLRFQWDAATPLEPVDSGWSRWKSAATKLTTAAATSAVTRLPTGSGATAARSGAGPMARGGNLTFGHSGRRSGGPPLAAAGRGRAGQWLGQGCPRGDAGKPSNRAGLRARRTRVIGEDEGPGSEPWPGFREPPATFTGGGSYPRTPAPRGAGPALVRPLSA